MTLSAFATLLTLLATTTVQTDTTLQVAHGARLNVTNFGGAIAVRGWSKNAVRVAATHSHHVRVLVRASGPNVDVRAASLRGVPVRVDYDISAPVWMPLTLSGVYSDVSVLGAKGEVSAETVKGDVVVKGGQGFLKLSSMQGSINTDGARGRLELSCVNGDVNVIDAEGDVSVQAVNGEVLLDRVRSRRVEAATVSGDVIYLGAIERGGSYRFASHSGDLDVALPDPADATVSVSTFSGDFESSFPVVVTGKRRGRLFDFTLGKGEALVQLESFGGTIRLRRAADAHRELRRRLEQRIRLKEKGEDE